VRLESFIVAGAAGSVSLPAAGFNLPIDPGPFTGKNFEPSSKL
jgi:hypothetical protein